MTRIAILSDIHANHFALNVVIQDIQTRGVDEVIVAGDLVGRGPQGDDVVQAIKAKGWKGVRGNHEDYLIAFRHKQVEEAWLSAPEWAASRWMADELSEDSLAYIEALPFSIRASSDSQVAVFHGTPRSNCEGLGAWSNESLLREILLSVDCEVMIVAHTHRAISWEIEGRLLVNVGSVGLPFNADTRAQYAILEKSDSLWKHEFIQVDYDVEAFIAHYHDCGFLEAGGISSRLLIEEIKYARPFLVPFQKWIEFKKVKESNEELESFLSWYDCHKSAAELAVEYPLRLRQ